MTYTVSLLPQAARIGSGLDFAAAPGVTSTECSLTTTKLSGARIMADSDNSRTLSRVTQVDLHSFVASSFPTHPGLADRLTRRLDIRNDDLAFIIWQQQCAARHQLIESCLRQEELGPDRRPLSGFQVSSPPAAPSLSARPLETSTVVEVLRRVWILRASFPVQLLGAQTQTVSTALGHR